MLRRSLLTAALLVALAASASAQGALAATPMLALSTASMGGHACVLTQSGKVLCWGDNHRGQLGVTTGISDSNGVGAAQLVPLARPAVQIAAGSGHTCALLDDGTVNCWGVNYSGQLGNSTNVSTLNANPAPAPVPLPNLVSQIAAGDFGTCFIYVDASAACIGDNSFGQLAFLPMNSAPNVAPKAMSLGGAAVKKITIGGNFACALLTTLAVKCMGFNPSGQLANSAHLDTGGATPVSAGLPGPVTDLDTGSGHGCAILQDSTTWCWGTDTSGQLGDGTADGADHYIPVKVSIGGAQSVALGFNHVCARLTAGGVDCWGGNLAGQLGVADNILSLNPNATPLFSGFDPNASFVAAGGPFTCAIRPDGTVQCAGENSASQLGVPRASLEYSYIPVAVPAVNVLDAAPGTARLGMIAAKPRLKFRKSGRKISVTARVKVSGVGAALPAADCSGKVTTRLEKKVRSRYRKVVSKSASLNVKKGLCGLDLRLKVASRYAGKKLTLRLIAKDGANTTGFDKRFSAKIKRPRR